MTVPPVRAMWVLQCLPAEVTLTVRISLAPHAPARVPARPLARSPARPQSNYYHQSPPKRARGQGRNVTRQNVVVSCPTRTTRTYNGNTRGRRIVGLAKSSRTRTIKESVRTIISFSPRVKQAPRFLGGLGGQGLRFDFLEVVQALVAVVKQHGSKLQQT